MTKSTSLNIPQDIKSPGASFVNADGTAWKTVYTADADGVLIKMLGATSTDTAAQNIQLGISTDAGVTTRVLGTVPVAANSGTNGVAAAVDLLASSLIPQLSIDSNGKAYLQLQGSALLQAKSLVAVTAAKTVDIVAGVEEY